jgi:allantoinase
MQPVEKLDLLIHVSRAITAEGESAKSIGIRGGRIVAIDSADAKASAGRVLELGPDVVLMPGLVDPHVHVCEPGNTDWEGFYTATKAAAAGGITTLVDMPLDSVPTTVTPDALAVKRRAANGQCHVDIGFWGGAVPGNMAELGPLYAAGVLGFKCFLSDSGSKDFPPVTPQYMEQVLHVLRPLDAPLIVHAESEDTIARMPSFRGRRYTDYLSSRPRGIENLAIAQVIEAARVTGARAHIAHLSSSDALPMLESARRDGVRISAESCPHYMTLCAEDIPDGATAVKCGPPIREASNRELLWRGLAQGILDMIVSDHSPCTTAMKELESGDFGSAWGGISSLQLSLPVMWTAARRKGFSLSDIASWMSTRPAQFAGLNRKGCIALGYDADFCVFAPDERFVVDPARLHHRNPVTPYAWHALTGVVRQTILRGQPVETDRPLGQLLARGTA